MPIKIGDAWHVVPKSEAAVYDYLYRGYEIKVIEVDTHLMGFCLYRSVFSDLVAINFMYIDEELRGARLAPKLIRACAGEKGVVFQTRKDIPPEKLFQIVKYHTKVQEKENLVTWFMEIGE
jgi:hypothetical protein